MKITTKKLFDVCNIYILFWLCLTVQNMFLSSSLLSMLFYIPYLLMTLYYVGKYYISYRPKKTMLAFSIFFAVQLCYGIALLILDNVSGTEPDSYLKMLFISLGPIYAFYSFTKQGVLTEQRMSTWFVIFIVVAICDYYNTMQQGLLKMETEETTNNASYSFVGLVPFIFLLRKNILRQILALAILYYFIISGLKRGAILIGAILLLWVIYELLKSVSKIKRLGFMLLTIIFLYVGYKFIVNFYENSDYFQHRIEQTMEGSSSGRDNIFSTLLNDYCNNYNIIQLLFGKGAYHTENIIGLKAHNDWLELLIDCGFIGIFLYLIYWISFVIELKKNRSNHLVYAMMGACFLFTLARTFFSMSFTNMPFYTCMILGYCFAYTHTCSNQQYTNKR